MDHDPQTQALTTRAPVNTQTLALASRLGQMYFASGYFRDGVKSALQAFVKIQHGLELGLSPVAAMRGIFISDQNGQITYSASVIATLIQNSGRFSYRVQKWTDQVCEIAFFEHGEPLGPPSVFTMADAARAGLTNKSGPWKSYPKAMLANRALTQGAKLYCSAVFNGVAPYTPEELDLSADAETGEWDAEAEVQDVPAEPMATADQKQALQAFFRAQNMRGPAQDAWLSSHDLPTLSQLTVDQAGHALAWANGLVENEPQPEPDLEPEPIEADVSAA